MTRQFIVLAVAVIFYVPAVLIADSPGLVPQLALGGATAAFLWLVARRGTVPAREIITAIAIAAIGECALSIGWGLYSYRNALIPLYVFFGHGIFYALAAETSRQRLLQPYASMITRGVLAAGSALAMASLILSRDSWGLVWWLIAAVLLIRGRNPLLLSACFVYTVMLEWLGTSIGNWRWAAEVPWLGLTSANPPSGVGVLYVVLDLVTAAMVMTLWRLPKASSRARRFSPIGDIALRGAAGYRDGLRRDPSVPQGPLSRRREILETSATR